MFLLRLDCAWNPAEASCPLVPSGVEVAGHKPIILCGLCERIAP